MRKDTEILFGIKVHRKISEWHFHGIVRRISQHDV